MTTRAGFVALAGRPNVGKSTLVNAIVGRKVAIVSDKPQTTRRAIRGVATRDEAQLVLVDLPGVQRPRDALTERMQRRVERELADSDVALVILNGEQGIGPGDRFIAAALRDAKVPVVIAINKVDRLDRGRTLAALQGAAELEIADDVFPVSARTGSGVPTLVEHLESLVPESPFLFDARDRSDQSDAVLLAELIREQVLRRTFQEGPARRRGRHRGRRAHRPEPRARHRARLGRGRVAEGHPHRLARLDDQGHRHRRPA